MTVRRHTKVTDGEVMEIRRRYAAGETQGCLARDYGISAVQVGRIVRGEARQDLPEVADSKTLEQQARESQERMAKLFELPQPKAEPEPEPLSLSNRLMAEAQALRNSQSPEAQADRLLSELANQDLERKGK